MRNTKEINTETEFGYVMKHLHKIKPTFISIFSLNTDLFDILLLNRVLQPKSSYNVSDQLQAQNGNKVSSKTAQ